jgi:ferric-dicitrate binding protein FerR (iron transport regulator)
MSPDDQRIWEEELLAETPGPGRERLNRMFTEDPAQLAAWIADRRLALCIASLAPRPDTAERVWLLLRARRPSRRLQALRLGRRSRPSLRPWLVAGMAASLIIGTILLLLPGSAPTPELWRDGRATGTTLAAAGSAGLPDAACELRWPDGTRATIAAGSRVSIDPLCALRLDHGSLALQVAPQRDGRRFAVATAASEVVVVGTRFRLDAGAHGTRLAVSEGVVELRPRDAGAQRIAAGETWMVPPAGTAARQLSVLWSLPDGEERLLGNLHRGAATANGYASVLETGSAGDRPIHIVWITSPKGQHLLSWRPGLTAALRLRITGGHGRIGCQFFIRRLARNFNVFGQPEPDADGWADLRLPLDRAAPYQPSKPPADGDGVCDLVVRGEDATTTFVVSQFSIDGSAPPAATHER